LHKEKKMCNLY